jgi:DNA-binding GntR family transcriptional regulator
MIPGSSKDAAREALAAELAEQCARLLSPHDWARVEAALDEMHDQLREDIADEAEFGEVFAGLVAGLIERLGNAAIETVPQARVYLASASAEHRTCATAWLRQRHH